MPVDVISPRSVYTQEINYVRFDLPSSLQVPKLIGSIPLNSSIQSVTCDITTSFNGGSSNPIILGVTPTGGELMAASDNTPGTPGHYSATRGLGTGLTQASPGPTSIGDPEGGVPLYASYAPTGSAPTQGVATLIVAYVPPPNS